MTQLTEYGKSVKKRMVDLDMRQNTLRAMVKEKTGLSIDTSYFGKIMVGKRNAPRIKAAINEILWPESSEQGDM